MSYKPSLKKIITIDYTARVAIISLVGVWLLKQKPAHLAISQQAGI